MGNDFQNKILLGSDIKNLAQGIYVGEFIDNSITNINGEVTLDNYDTKNSNLTLNISDNSKLLFNKVNILSKDLNININVYNNTILDFNLVIINTLNNKVDLKINMLGSNSKVNAKVRVINKFNDNINIIFTGFIKENTKDNVLIEDLKGLITGNDTIKISPIMEVLTNEVEANHLVTIGSFNKNDLFYLNGRGLNINSAKDLLIKSFVSSILDEKLQKLVKMEVIHYE